MLTGGVSVTDGVFQPWHAVQSHPVLLSLAPSLNLSARWSGSSIRSATVTLHGETFNNVGGGNVERPRQASISPRSAIAPAFMGETATLIVPFVFQGAVRAHQRQFRATRGNAHRRGHGHTPAPAKRQPRRRGTTSAATYEFQPIPEPATLLLTGAGITTLWAHRRRRRQTNCSRA